MIDLRPRMWKALVILACVAAIDIVICDVKCGANERYVVCPDTMCIPRNCSQRGFPVPCPILGPEGNCPGKPACICVENYLRDDSTGVCVPSKKCKQTVDDTKAPDESVAANVTVTAEISSNISSDGCGYPPICGKNEVYNNCTYTGCTVRRCSELGYPLKCDNCTPGCVCEDGYARADNNTCIPILSCPSCGGEKNAQQGCGNNCGRTCSTYNKPPTPCPLFCIFNGCDCRPSFVYDYNVKACVLPKDCTPICKENEQYSSCFNRGCDARNCSQLGKPVPCVKLKPEACIKGCVCVPGYLKASNGTCVPKDQCTPKCIGKNEYWEECIKGCSDQACDSIGKIFLCPFQKVCASGCRCKPGFYRDKNKDCIPENQCPKCTGKNEYWESCIKGCSSQSCDARGIIPFCPLQKGCASGCRCKPGYYRDKNNHCIPECQCPPLPTTSIETTTTPTTTVVSTSSDRGTGLTGLLDGIAEFTGKCLYNRMKSAPSENIALSAMSVTIPISILCLYSEGVAYDQCIETLNLKDKEDIRNTFPLLTSSFDGQTSVNFSTAAKIYSNKNYQLSDALKKDAVNFKAGAQELDFSNAEQAAQIINAWVESQTNNRIKDLVSKDMFNALTRMVLVNAIYFKGDWLYQFDEDNTKDEDFYLSDGTTKKTKLMSQLSNFKYAGVPELNCTALEMKYKGENFTMLIVLPNAVEGALTLAGKLQYSENWNKVYGSLYNERVQVYLPSFEINTSTDLKDLLKKVNITKWFEADNSGISGVLEKPEDIYISDAIQKAFIKCDEKGSEAAAANAFVGATTTAVGPPPRLPKLFRADHGFLFYILLKGTAVFSGHCGNP